MRQKPGSNNPVSLSQNHRMRGADALEVSDRDLSLIGPTFSENDVPRVKTQFLGRHLVRGSPASDSEGARVKMFESHIAVNARSGGIINTVVDLLGKVIEPNTRGHTLGN